MLFDILEFLFLFIYLFICFLLKVLLLNLCSWLLSLWFWSSTVLYFYSLWSKFQVHFRSTSKHLLPWLETNAMQPVPFYCCYVFIWSLLYCRLSCSALREGLVFTEVSPTDGQQDGRLWLFMSRSLHLPLTPPVSPITLCLSFSINMHHHPHHHQFLLNHCCHSRVCVSLSLYAPFLFVTLFYMCQWLCFLSVFLFDGCKLIAFVCLFSVHCVDSETSAVRSFGDTWLRWRGQRVDYCRCALRGQQRCHIVPVISECVMDVNTYKPMSRIECSVC